MVKLFLYSAEGEKVYAGEFESEKAATLFAKRFSERWPEFSIVSGDENAEENSHRSL